MYGGVLVSNFFLGGGDYVYFCNLNGWMIYYYKYLINGWVFGNVISIYNLDYRVNGDIVVGDNG